MCIYIWISIVTDGYVCVLQVDGAVQHRDMCSVWGSDPGPEPTDGQHQAVRPTCVYAMWNSQPEQPHHVCYLWHTPSHHRTAG